MESKILNEVLAKIKAKFGFMGLTDTEILSMIRKIAVKVDKKTIKGSYLKSKLFEETVSCCYKIIGKETAKKNYKYIDSFIKEKVLIGKNINDSIININKFINLLNESNITVDLPLGEHLVLSNNNLKRCLEKVAVGKDLNGNYFEKFVLNSEFMNLLEIYCIYNDIKFDNMEVADVEIIKYATVQPENDSLWIYMKEASKYPLLSVEEERALIAEYRKTKDEVIKEKLINSNLRLVMSIGKNFLNRGLDYSELIQEGNIGLMKAVERFQASSGCKFSTYATYWIKQAIGRALSETGRAVRLPAYKYDELNRYKSLKSDFYKRFGYEASWEDMVEFADISEEKVKEYESLICPLVSTNIYVGEDNDTTLENILVDKSAVSPENECVENNLREFLLELLDTLSEREKYILIHHYGMNGNDRETYDKIGEHFNVSRQRIQQIEAKALGRIRKMDKVRNLKDFY